MVYLGVAKRPLVFMSATLGQLIRYGIVGVISNATGYILYLVITAFGTEHKLAMTLLYAVGVAQTFIFNRRWTFCSEGAAGPSLVRYVVAYALGYLINYLTLLLLVDRFGIPHQLVMAVLIVVMAIYFFLAQKFWVFRKRAAAT